ncbi:MAG: hypothetical protein AB7T03_03705 [Bacilli bacterium]
MKFQEKVDLIRQELNSQIKPLDFHHILTNTTIEASLLPFQKPKAFYMKWQIAIISFLAFALIIPLSLALRPNSPSDDALADSTPLYNSTDEVYGFIATSAVAMIYNTSDVFESDDFLEPSGDLLVYDELNFLNRYLSPIEMMLSYNYHHFYRQASDHRLFANKIVYDGVGLQGENLFYEIYFNEYLVANNRFTIDCYVTSDSEVFYLKGEKQIVGNQTLLQMTYFLDVNNTKDFVRVAKDLQAEDDTYQYMVVKNNIIINDYLLSLVQDQEVYATLENILSEEKQTTFKIYASDTNNYEIDYVISSGTAVSENTEVPLDNEPTPVLESGSIVIDVGTNASSFFITSNSFSGQITINNPNN